jgi:hypothetical protein
MQNEDRRWTLDGAIDLAGAYIIIFAVIYFFGQLIRSYILGLLP